MFSLKKLTIMLILCIGLLLSGNQTSQAGDYKGDLLVRLNASYIAPDASADVYFGGIIPGASADITSEIVPTATITYFFDKNLAIELLCCAAKHSLSGTGAIEGVDLGDTWIFPPALTLQYHFDSKNGFKPYVGAGVQYIAFFNESSGDLGELEIDNAFGFTLQAGVDIEMGQGWYLNADVKKTWLKTDAKWASGHTADVDVDPLIISAGVGYRFNLFGSSK